MPFSTTSLQADPMGTAQFHGIYPILYAFFDANGQLDAAQMRMQVDHCISTGAHGIAVLGLVTEVHKMDVNERLALVELVGDQIGGRVPYAVTVCEPSIDGQIAFARAAATAGADWVILQPPAIAGLGERDLLAFFGSVADAIDIDVAVQNNPLNLPVSLSPDAIVSLQRNHPNISLLKGEGFSVDIARIIEGTGGAMRVFGGHGWGNRVEPTDWGRARRAQALRPLRQGGSFLVRSTVHLPTAEPCILNSSKHKASERPHVCTPEPFVKRW